MSRPRWYSRTNQQWPVSTRCAHRPLWCMLSLCGVLAATALVQGRHRRLKRERCLCVQLADAGFGHPEDLPDLGQRQVLVVVEADDDPIPGAEILDRLVQCSLALVGLKCLPGLLD